MKHTVHSCYTVILSLLIRRLKHFTCMIVCYRQLGSGLFLPIREHLRNAAICFFMSHLDVNTSTLSSYYRGEWLRPSRVARTTAPSCSEGTRILHVALRRSSTWSTASQPWCPWSSGAWRCSISGTRCTASPAQPRPSNLEKDPSAVVENKIETSEKRKGFYHYILDWHDLIMVNDK